MDQQWERIISIYPTDGIEGENMNPFFQITKIVEAITKSGVRVDQLDRRYNLGEITAGECIDLIVEEQAKLKEQIDRIEFDEVKEYGLMAQNYN